MILEIIAILGFYTALFGINVVLEERIKERRYERKMRAREYMEIVD